MIGRYAAIATAVVVTFLCAFMAQGEASDAAQEATAFALMSAVFWGIGSVGGPNRLNNGMNVFAALAAAAATGFAVPSEPFCKGRYAGEVCAIRSDLVARGVLPSAATPSPGSSTGPGPLAPGDMQRPR